jgi:PPOX class probable FMN-dependent enzyme
MFPNLVTSEAELRAMMGRPRELALRKELTALDAHGRAFIEHAPFLLVATANAAGECDVSPKGDAPGFVRVVDERHLLIPDRPGNKRYDGMTNVLANPHVGLIFLIPGREDTLRVNGRACITRDPAILESFAVNGRPALLAIGVEVEQCFMHCAKAFKRSALWQPDRWPDTSALASPARLLWEATRPAGQTVEDLERQLEEGYRTRLY